MKLRRAFVFAAGVAALGAMALASGCGGDDENTLTIYSGRSQDLVGPILEQFSDETGVDIRVRYGDTAELAGVILEEGDNSPADLFFAQDAGSLGAVAAEGRLAVLPDDLLDKVLPQYRADSGQWIGISGRARVVAYNTDAIDEATLPDDIESFTDPEWEGRIGWVPTNASFQSFITAFRLLEGDEAAEAWLQGIRENDPVEFPNNTAAVEGVANGEVDVAFVNHYYAMRLIAEQGDGFKARNHFLGGGDVGALVNVAGAGILEGSNSVEDARRFIEFMLAPEAQAYFAAETHEYPMLESVAIDPLLPPLSELQGPDLDLSNLDDLAGTQALLRETEVLP